jgi:hypothetical protein
MKKLTIGVGATATAAAVTLVGIGVHALAATAPPVDVHRVGTLTLQAADGSAITSGTLGGQLAAKAVGDAHLTGTRAVLYAYVYGDPAAAPVAVAPFAPAGVWTGTQLTAAQSFSGTPAVATDITAQSLQQFVGGHRLPANGLVELRLRTIDAGTLSDDYDALDIYVNKAAGTWSASSDGTVTNPVITTMTLSASRSAVTVGGTVTLTATVSPAAEGSVQFKDNGAAIGAPVRTSGGRATSTVTVRTAGSHSYTATFTPTDATAYHGSSASVPAVVTATAGSKGDGGGKKPTGVTRVASTVTVKIAKKVKHTAKVRATVTVKAAGTVPTGTVTVIDGKKTLASKALVGGKVKLNLKKLKKGKHKIRASYAGSTTVAAASSKTITVRSK